MSSACFDLGYDLDLPEELKSQESDEGDQAPSETGPIDYSR
jgi:hypothetical protein